MTQPRSRVQIDSIIAGVADIDDDDDGSVGRIGLSVKLPMPSGLFISLQLALFISQLQKIYPRYKYVQGEFLSLLLTHFPTRPVRSSAGCRAPGLVVYH